MLQIPLSDKTRAPADDQGCRCATRLAQDSATTLAPALDATRTAPPLCQLNQKIRQSTQSPLRLARVGQVPAGLCLQHLPITQKLPTAHSTKPHADRHRSRAA